MTPAASFVVLSSLFLVVTVLERVPSLRFAPSPFPRPYLATDGAWYLVAAAANVVSTVAVAPYLSTLSVPVVGRALAGSTAPTVVVALVVYDFVAFAVHVGLHRWDRLWAFHKIHHSSLQLDAAATTRTHMFEHLVRNVPAQATLFALGASTGTVASALVVYAAFALHGHSNLRVGGRWIEAVFVTPRLHRLHHLPATTQKNFGTVFTIWDRLFGRLVQRDAGPGERTGVPGEVDEYPQRFLPAFRRPLQDLRA